jgi:hypothetical protein
MKRTSGLIVMALGVLWMHTVVPAPVVRTRGPAAIRAAHTKTSVVPAEDSGDDGDDSDSDDAE